MSESNKKEEPKHLGKAQLPQRKPKPYPLRGTLQGISPPGRGITIIRKEKEFRSEQKGVIDREVGQ